MAATKKSMLRFAQYAEAGRKTASWGVSSTGLVPLGHVRWFSQWRRYCFFPLDQHLVFDAECLRELAEFLQSQTAAYKAKEKTE